MIDELDPVNPDALEVLDEIYQRMNQVASLIEVLRLRADVVVEDETRVRLKLRLATLLRMENKLMTPSIPTKKLLNLTRLVLVLNAGRTLLCSWCME